MAAQNDLLPEAILEDKLVDKCLYDASSADFRNRDKGECAIAEIANKLSQTGDILALCSITMFIYFLIFSWLQFINTFNTKRTFISTSISPRFIFIGLQYALLFNL